MCRGLILNSLVGRLYDRYSTKESLIEIWTTLKTKYQNERKCMDKFLALNYFDFKMSDNKPVMNQLHELQILVSRLRDLQMNIIDSLQIGPILSKLPIFVTTIGVKVLHQPESFTLNNFRLIYKLKLK